MVDLSEKVEYIRNLIDKGEYFTINRARQYGKTTTINAVKEAISKDYTVISLDFQGISKSGFETEQEFVQEFCRLIIKKKRTISVFPKEIENTILEYVNQREPKVKLGELFSTLNEWCEISENGIVLIIDEVDSATNNQVFLDFLAQLRDGYISRDTDGIPSFQSVILAGVTDVKHLKSKIRGEADSKENSPWNIAADFTIDMSLSEIGIKGMLDEYEADHCTGMDTEQIAKQIREYTNGYPFLVSRICQLIDERFVPGIFENLSAAWTNEGVEQAVKTIITEKNTLFDSLMEKIRDYDRLRAQMEYLLFRGETIEYLPDNKEQEQLIMYGFVINDHNTVVVANKIFEMRLYKYFVGESRFAQEVYRGRGSGEILDLSFTDH